MDAHKASFSIRIHTGYFCPWRKSLTTNDRKEDPKVTPTSKSAQLWVALFSFFISIYFLSPHCLSVWIRTGGSAKDWCPQVLHLLLWNAKGFSTWCLKKSYRIFLLRHLSVYITLISSAPEGLSNSKVTLAVMTYTYIGVFLKISWFFPYKNCCLCGNAIALCWAEFSSILSSPNRRKDSWRKWA